MTILHYQVSRLDHSWIVSCEAVPIDMFDGRKSAISAAERLVRAARRRGDDVILHIDRPRTGHMHQATGA